MLIKLKIKDFAIIDDLEISFTDGMNVFTGETGAGKSIIIDAVNLILGSRGSTDYLRSGCDESRIEALFDVSQNDPLQKMLTEFGYEPSDDLVIRRVLSATGKSRVMINDSFSTLNTLSMISPLLINIYGQNEHQELLSRESHLNMLDAFGGLLELSEEFKGAYLAFTEVELKLKELSNAAENRDREMDFIEYQIKEINAAEIKEGEEEELKREKELAANAEKIFEICHDGFEGLYSGQDSVCSRLNGLIARIEKIKELDNSFENYQTQMKDALYSLEDAAFFFRDYQERADFSPASIDDIESRLHVIGGIKKKYGAAFENIMRTKNELEMKLEELHNITVSKDHLEKRKDELHPRMTGLAKRLSSERKKAAELLSGRLSEEFKSLGMANAKFMVKFHENSEGTKLSESGSDIVEFYFSANPGEDFKPLLKVASGGELSRIMLALKNVAKADSSPATYIFDEVDSGIGGKTAHIVGAKLKSLSGTNQVICVTHLPQIASYADSHYVVSKSQTGGRTITRVRKLGDDESVKEVARLISGEEITEHSLKHAADIITKNKKRGRN